MEMHALAMASNSTRKIPLPVETNTLETSSDNDVHGASDESDTICGSFNNDCDSSTCIKGGTLPIQLEWNDNSCFTHVLVQCIVASGTLKPALLEPFVRV
jgi:hypothetical protein